MSSLTFSLLFFGTAVFVFVSITKGVSLLQLIWMGVINLCLGWKTRLVISWLHLKVWKHKRTKTRMEFAELKDKKWAIWYAEIDKQFRTGKIKCPAPMNPKYAIPYRMTSDENSEPQSPLGAEGATGATIKPANHHHTYGCDCLDCYAGHYRTISSPFTEITGGYDNTISAETAAKIRKTFSTVDSDPIKPIPASRPLVW